MLGNILVLCINDAFLNFGAILYRFWALGLHLNATLMFKYNYNTVHYYNTLIKHTLIYSCQNAIPYVLGINLCSFCGIPVTKLTFHEFTV